MLPKGELRQFDGSAHAVNLRTLWSEAGALSVMALRREPRQAVIPWVWSHGSVAWPRISTSHALHHCPAHHCLCVVMHRRGVSRMAAPACMLPLAPHEFDMVYLVSVPVCVSVCLFLSVYFFFERRLAS